MGKQLLNVDLHQFQLNYHTLQWFLQPLMYQLQPTGHSFKGRRNYRQRYSPIKTTKNVDMEATHRPANYLPKHPRMLGDIPYTPPPFIQSTQPHPQPTSPPLGSCPCNKKCCMDDSGGRSFAESHL